METKNGNNKEGGMTLDGLAEIIQKEFEAVRMSKSASRYHQDELDSHKKRLDNHRERLDNHRERLNNHGEMIKAIENKLKVARAEC